MILDTFVQVKIYNRNVKYYRELGYEVQSMSVDVKIKDLPTESNLKINVKCDVCGSEKVLRYQKYNKNVSKYNLYTCNSSCAQIKNRMTLKNLYGSENFNRSQENRLLRKIKYDRITENIEKVGHIQCSKCGNKENLAEFLKNIAGRYKKICRLCRNHSFNLSRNKNPHIKAWRSVLKSFLFRINGKKLERTHLLLGYSPAELKENMEAKFKDGMCWENYGQWHIDHIVHVSLFKVDTPYHIVNGLNNLRPLDSKINISRHNNLDKDCLENLDNFKPHIKESVLNFMKSININKNK